MIRSFTGEYRWLSNFWPVTVTFDGQSYKSVEHAYQAAKSLDPKVRKRIQRAGTAADAKRLGSKITLRSDWERVKDLVMILLVRRKFAHPHLRELLIATDDVPLIHGNDHGDTYWGTYRSNGLNRLGEILTYVRKELNE